MVELHTVIKVHSEVTTVHELHNQYTNYVHSVTIYTVISLAINSYNNSNIGCSKFVDISFMPALTG